MLGTQGILVVLESADQDDLALLRGQLIAHGSGAHLHLLVCDRSQDHSASLTELKLQLKDQGYSVSAEQAWSGTPHQTIIEVQLAEGCALVIKRHRAEQSLKSALLTPVDWRLLRECPAAVLMVKSQRPWQGASILAAVDVGTMDGGHQHLHESIIEYGRVLARLTQGALHVLSAHAATLTSVAGPPMQGDTESARYREACQAFELRFGIDDSHLHIEQGNADVLIPYMAGALQAAVTVIGTVARSGLRAALVGNTAEAVLDTLEGDVLVLKTPEIIEHLLERAGR